MARFPQEAVAAAIRSFDGGSLGVRGCDGSLRRRSSPVGFPAHLGRLPHRKKMELNKFNALRTREGWTSDPFPPPLALAETDDGPSRGPFSFWFQRGLVVATALRRLSKRSKSVSEPHLSLIDRPRSAEGRFQNSI